MRAMRNNLNFIFHRNQLSGTRSSRSQMADAAAFGCIFNARNCIDWTTFIGSADAILHFLYFFSSLFGSNFSSCITFTPLFHVSLHFEWRNDEKCIPSPACQQHRALARLRIEEWQVVSPPNIVCIATTVNEHECVCVKGVPALQKWRRKLTNWFRQKTKTNTRISSSKHTRHALHPHIEQMQVPRIAIQTAESFLNCDGIRHSDVCDTLELANAQCVVVSRLSSRARQRVFPSHSCCILLSSIPAPSQRRRDGTKFKMRSQLFGFNQMDCLQSAPAAMAK